MRKRIGKYDPEAYELFHEKNKEKFSDYGECHKQSYLFVKKYGGDIFSSGNEGAPLGEHTIAVKDSKVYDTIFGYNGVSIQFYEDNVPMEFSKRNFLKVEKSLKINGLL